MENIHEIENLINIYRDKILVPDTKLKNKIIICPVGHNASGKTTVIKRISSTIPLVRISTDEIRIIARAHGYEEDFSRIVAAELIREYMKKDYSIAADFNCSTLEVREVIKTESLLNGFHTVFIKIDPPHSWITNKIKNMEYKADGLYKDVGAGIAEIERSFEIRELPDINYDHIFDTSSSTLNKDIDNFAKELISKHN